MARLLRLLIVQSFVVFGMSGQTSAILALNRAAVSSPSLAVLEQRQELFEELMRTSPDSVPEAMLSASDIGRIKAAVPGSEGLLEEEIGWDGMLEMRVEDDFVHRRSITHWRIRTSGGGFEMYFGKDSSPGGWSRGAPIHVEGVRSGRNVAVSKISQTAPIIQPDAGSGTQSCSTTTGPQNIAVMEFTFPGATTYPTGLNNAFFQQTWFGTTGTSLNNYWQQTSYGLTSATGQIFGPFALPQSYTCAQSDALATAAFQAAAGTVDFTQFSRFALLFPESSCTYQGMGTIGCEVLPTTTSQVGSVAWLPLFDPAQTTYEVGVVAHEHGHNLGLNDANSVDYGAAPLGALDDPGVNNAMGDPYSAMATSTSNSGVNVIGQYSAEQTALYLGWLPPSGFSEVTAAGTFTIVPYENSTGLRALRIQRDTATSSWLWVEYRQPIGIADSTLAAIPGTNVYGGALIHYENPFLDYAHTYLVDFNPVATPNNFATSVLLPGQSWTDPASGLRLTVNSATSAGLSITVSYDTYNVICIAGIEWVVPLPAAGGPYSVDSRGTPCTASTSTPWIAFTGATTVSGSTDISFNAAANTGVSQREGFITVTRDTIPVLQAGTATTFLGSSPNSGTGATTQTTFSFSDPKGASDISNVTIQFLGGTGCQVSASPQSNNFSLLNDTGTGSVGSVTAGAVQSISNSQCTLSGIGSQFSSSGGLLKATLNMSFSMTAPGSTHRILATVADSVATNGPFPAGTWTVPEVGTQIAVPLLGTTQAAATGIINNAGLTVGSVTMAYSTSYAAGLVISSSPPPGTLVPVGSAVNLVVSLGSPFGFSVTPNSGSGSSQIFTVTYSDTEGASYLNNREFALGTKSQCQSLVNPGGIYLLNDSKSAYLGPMATYGALSNSYCTLNVAGTGVVNNGNTSTVTLSITFKPSFVGAMVLYAYADDINGLMSNWQQVSYGSYTVLSPPSSATINLTVFRPPSGTWYVDPAVGGAVTQQWGLQGDIPITGDFDGDGVLDYAVWRPSNGVWYITYSSSGLHSIQTWGLTGDIPVPGDYDGDGRTDFAFWRPSNGTWYIWTAKGGFLTQQWGLPGDQPVVADFDGDGKADFAVWRPSNGTWYIIPSASPTTVITQQWGLPGDEAVAGDYDGDKKADFAVYRPSNSTWYIVPSTAPTTSIVQQWGLANDIPVPRDYDQDGKMDIAIWRPSTGTWYFRPSGTPGTYQAVQWGLYGDIPLYKPAGN